ncbi:MAG TPA: SWIM zinc finger family protein [Kofleriaceae bacterium]|nr:SWIM zinc finger family protein [Kofleriaceae bacterium]
MATTATAAAVTTDPTEFKPLSTTREERGRQIAKRGGIRALGARYVVPSQSANANVPTYLVDVIEQTCTCPDYELRRLRCKHQEAVLFWLAWEGAVNVETGEITLPKKKQQSKQNWPAYNRAQTTERLRVPQLLHALCLGVPDAEREHGAPGRKPIPNREAIFGLVGKVYSGCSGRRAEADLAAYVERGFLSRAWDANTMFRAMENPAMTPILTRLIEESAGPLAQVENAAGQFAIDSTGVQDERAARAGREGSRRRALVRPGTQG